MRILGNILWHVPFFGWVVALAYALVGCLFCLTVVGIPLGLGLFQISSLMLAPFTKGVVNRSDIESITEEKQSTAMKIWRIIIRILYFPFGLLMSLQIILCVGVLFMTIIGIPCAIAYAKCLGLVFNPTGKVCVSRDVAEEIKRRKAMKIVDNMAKQPLGADLSNSSLTGTTEINSEFIVKAEMKSNEDLKGIISNRDDFHPMLVSAAEKVLLGRMMGKQIEIGGTLIATEEIQKQAEVGNGIDNQKDESVEDKIATPLPEDTIAVALNEKKPDEVLENGNQSSKSNTGVIVAVITIALVLLVSGIGYFVWYVPYAKDRDALRTYVLATNVFLRSGQVAGVEYNILDKVPYGSEIITYNKGIEWSTVKVNGVEGFMASDYLLTKADFDLLHGTWGDLDSRDCIISSKCRLAILDFYKRENFVSGSNGWQVFTKPRDAKPNSIFYPRLFNRSSKYTDFIFIIKNNLGNNRLLVCYSFEDETEKPVFRFSIEVPSTGYINNVQRTSTGAIIKFDSGEQVTATF